MEESNEATKTEIKSDFDFQFCELKVCLVDAKYCEFGCEIMKEKKKKNKQLSYDQISDCIWRRPEDVYLKVRSNRR